MNERYLSDGEGGGVFRSIHMSTDKSTQLLEGLNCARRTRYICTLEE
jgi:hypothetical protein